MLTRLRPLTKTLINPTFVNERMHDNRVMGLSPVTHSLLEHHLSDVHFELYTLVGFSLYASWTCKHVL